MIKRIRMPKEDLETLEKFLDLSAELQNYVIQKLTELSPEFNLKIIVKDILEKTDYTQKDVQKFIKFIVNLYINFFHFKGEIEEFNEEVIIPSIILSDSKLKTKDGNYDSIKSIFKKILSLDINVGIISKIPYLSQENPNIYLTSHVITDLRYIFYKDPSEIPDYAIIKHTLKIDTITTRKVSEIFLTLNIKDLIELKNNIERAIKKEKSLQELCKKNKIVLLKEVDFNGV